MKKLPLLATALFLLLCSLCTNAQGIYQLWGMSSTGGDDYLGSLFSSNASGDNYQKRYQVTRIDQGYNPQHADPVEYNGKLYGTASLGGAQGYGVIFEWNPATNIYTKKIDFNDVDGKYPFGSLTCNNGKFYGMTSAGGANDRGVIFEWNPTSNTYTKKIDLDDAGGSYPQGSLLFNNGKFYGMTSAGGVNDKGVIFEWDPTSNTYTKKIDLTAAGGSAPQGGLAFRDGKFYGLTAEGGANDKGVIFEWNPTTNTYTKKIDLSTTVGSTPYGSLAVKDSKLYGITSAGGANDRGVIFEWVPGSNTYTKKIDLSASTGSSPFGSLAMNGTKFYGMTRTGGTNNKGTIFEWDPASNTYTKKMDLSTSSGCSPRSSLSLSGSKFYGLTWQGGSINNGVLFEWDPATNAYAKKIELNVGFDGTNPSGNLTRLNGKFFGVTGQGGNNNIGVLFEWNPVTETYTKKFDFTGSNGSAPLGSLQCNAGKLYGMTYKGGSNDMGVIFEWDPATNTYTKKIDLDGTNGSYPQGNLTLKDGKFYGMTYRGGANDQGVIFEWDPATNTYTKKIDLNSTDGNYPPGSLTQNGTRFYGMTEYGGINDAGVIFEWDPATNIYSKKIDLSNAGGEHPPGSLTFKNNKFYGVTNSGGADNQGVIFEWDPLANVYTKKFDFNDIDGKSPQGTLTVSGEKLYGMVNGGGADNRGVFFEWDPINNIYTIKRNFVQSDGNGPGHGNDFILSPVPVAKGTPNSCTGFASVTINNSNNNVWVPIVDNNGDAVAEIKANGNNLGVVNTSMYINNGTVREDGAKRLYLDRNLTITSQTAPTSAVDLRLYIKNSEYEALKSAINSDGQPSGILGIADLGIYKNENSCLPAVMDGLVGVSTSNDSWEADYVLSGSVDIGTVSSFYFLSKANGSPLPLARIEFDGQLVNNDGNLVWKTYDEINTQSFDLERSTDGRNFSTTVNVIAVNRPGTHQYFYTDKSINLLGVPVVYYRLKLKDRDGHFMYSSIVALNIKGGDHIALLYPNPATDKVNVSIFVNKKEKAQLRIIDESGRIIKQQPWELAAGANALPININNLANGVYYVELLGETINEHKRFIKQ